jgi:hypothetical protein
MKEMMRGCVMMCWIWKNHNILSDINNSHEDAQLNPKPKGMCTFLLNIQSLLYLLHLAKRLCQEENPSKIEANDNNGVFIDINGVLIDIDSVLIDIDGVLININSVLIDINVQPLTIITTVESKTTNPVHFFSQPFEHIGANGKVKKHPGWGD